MQKNKPLFIVCFSAILIGLEIVLNRFCSINTMGLKIGFAFIPPTLAAIMYGPLAGATVYAVSDFLGAILFPIGTYHPGFTVCAAVMGIVSGLMLYRKDKVPLFPNIIFTVFINCILIGLFINTFWVSMLYGSKTYLGWFVYRLSEYAVMVPVQIAVIPLLINISKRIKLL